MSVFSTKGRVLLSAALVVGFMAGWVEAQEIPSVLVRYPEMIIHNGKIVTMDDESLSLPGSPGTIVQAMAVRDGRILVLGSDTQVLRLAGPETRVFNLGGRTVVPGLIEKHSHIHNYAIDNHNEGLKLPFYGTSVEGENVEEVLKNVRNRLRELEDEVEPGLPIWMAIPRRVGPLAIARGVLNKRLLDELAPKHPVFVRAPISSYIFNSAGRKLLDDYAPKYAGKPDEAVVGGRVSEIFLNGAVMAGHEEILATALEREMRHFTSFGVTTIGSRVHTPAIFKAYRLLDSLDRLPARFAIYMHAELSGIPDYFKFYGDHTGMGSSDYLWEAGVSLEGFDTFSADVWCTDVPPIDPVVREMLGRVQPCRGAHGDFEREQIQGMLDAELRTVQIHGGADKTNDYFFEALEEAMEKNGMTIEETRAKQHTLEHLRFVRPDQIAKFKYYGIIAGPDNAGCARTAVQWYGEQYATWVKPIRSFIEGGVYVAHAADSHFREGENTPWSNLWWEITRKCSDGQTFGDLSEAVDRVTALKTHTTWARKFLAREDIGFLKEGNLADFVVLDKDYFTIPVDDIPSIKPVLTVIGNKVSFENPGVSF